MPRARSPGNFQLLIGRPHTRSTRTRNERASGLPKWQTDATAATSKGIMPLAPQGNSLQTATGYNTLDKLSESCINLISSLTFYIRTD